MWKVEGWSHPHNRPWRVLIYALCGLLVLVLWLNVNELMLPTHYRDPCTGKMVPRRMQDPDWFDEQALKRAEGAYRRGESQKNIDRNLCEPPPAGRAERAALSASIRTSRATARTEVVGEDRRAYDEVRRRGYSDSEAKQIAPDAKRLCQAVGGADC